MQEIITYIIGVIAAIIIGRWLFLTLKGRNKDGCSTCDGCSHRSNCK